jgi:hypothetical protein
MPIEEESTAAEPIGRMLNASLSSFLCIKTNPALRILLYKWVFGLHLGIN